MLKINVQLELKINIYLGSLSYLLFIW